MDDHHPTALPQSMEELYERFANTNLNDVTSVLELIYNLGMGFEREQFMGARHYERNPERQAYANGYKHKRVDTGAGTLHLRVPKTRGHGDDPFYPSALDRGARSTRALRLTVAEMYFNGVSTRDVEAILRTLGIENTSPTQVSRMVKELDEKLEAWRNRELGEFKGLILDARYEKMRGEDGIVRDVAVLSAVGIDPDGQRRILGVSCALSEAEIHWRAFLESLVARGLRGVELIVSDDHAGLRAARRAVFGGVKWQRCQFHLVRNACHHAPNLAVRKRIATELREVWNAPTLAKAEAALAALVQAYRETAPKLADWLEHNVAEALTVFAFPERCRQRLRTTNMIERALQQEIKRRTVKIRVFPNEASLLRVVSAVLIEIDDNWVSARQAYLTWDPVE